MSVIVRGMDMPKDCFECMVDCPVGVQRFIVIGRPRGCPLVEIPTPHGRLGDLDKLWDRMYNYTDNEGAKMPFGDNDFMIHKDSACELIEDTPTVIEAEGET